MLKAITHYDQIPISAVVAIIERETRKKEEALARAIAKRSSPDKAPATKGGSQ